MNGNTHLEGTRHPYITEPRQGRDVPHDGFDRMLDDWPGDPVHYYDCAYSGFDCEVGCECRGCPYYEPGGRDPYEY